MYVDPRCSFQTAFLDHELATPRSQPLRPAATALAFPHDACDGIFDDPRDGFRDYHVQPERSLPDRDDYQRFDDSPIHKNIFAYGLYKADQEMSFSNVRICYNFVERGREQRRHEHTDIQDEPGAAVAGGAGGIA